MPNSARAIFTLSLDCEGFWGMADRPAVLAERQISGRALADAYEFIARALRRNAVRATAAFVSTFCCEKDLLQELIPDLEALESLRPGWLTHVLPLVHDGNEASLDGLDGHRLWRLLADEGHEIGWHGATHLPLDVSTPIKAVEQELRIAQRIFQALDQRLVSVVFPRNRIGHLDCLRPLGFTNYRAALPADPLSRFASYTSELRIWGTAEAATPYKHDGWCVIPAGHFLNWPRGVRRLVTVDVTVRRWVSMLESAARNGGMVHMWFHPHNLVTAPAMRESFSRILDHVGKLVRRGDLLNFTMGELQERYDRSLVA
jgi:peptidoglycan/xylan/chitin deacetylase (PgdA/CDA1 family)